MQTYTRHRWSGFLVLATVWLGSCQSATPLEEFAAAGERPLLDGEFTADVAVEDSAPRVEREDPVVPRVGEESTESSPGPAGTRAGDPSIARFLKRTARELSLDGLVTELDGRLREHLEDATGKEEKPDEGADGAPDGNALERGEERRAVLQGLVALSFLKPRRQLLGILPGAVEALRRVEREDLESRLLAAAFLQRAGLTGARDDLLTETFGLAGGETTGRMSGTDVPSSAGKTGAFRLERLTFASRIESFRRYTVRPSDFVPGEKTLIYGEFAGFHERREQGDGKSEGRDGSSPLHFSRLRGTFRLLDANGELLHSGTFLSAERGRMSSRKPRERINFWASYRLSGELSAGDYRLRVIAEDLEGHQQAAADLPLRILGPGE